MNQNDIAHARLANQRLTETTFTTAAEVVAWLVAVQAQDYAAARWALGQRLPPTTDAAIERAFNEGLILRTHVLRPTWHFVTPDDIRPLLALTAPRVHQANGSMYRQLGLDAATLSRGAEVIARALGGGRALTRDELKIALDGAGIAAGGADRAGQWLAYVVMYAELEGLIVSGPRRGKQFTYMLLDERAPGGRTVARDEALVEVARRFFLSHGPATAADFANWSGLTLSEARQGLDAVAGQLNSETVEGQTYWFADAPRPPRAPSPTAHLLSIYDEYTIGYKDRRAIVSAEDGARLATMGNALQNVIVMDGRVVGTWRRTVSNTAALVETRPFRPFSDTEEAAIDAAIERYGVFLELPAVRQ